MDILRQKEAGKWTIGDQITISLKDMGEFTATVQKTTDEAILFIFDDYVACRPMNEVATNKGGYETSDLKQWIDTELSVAFPDELRRDITSISLPTVGMMLGHEDEWCNKYCEPDEDEQLELMKLRKNRVAYFNNECEWGWLRNAIKKEVSSTNFAYVTCRGNATCNYASYSLGVRPVFWVRVRKPEEPCAPRTKDDQAREANANYTKAVYDSYVKAGFSEEQAFDILLTLLGSAPEKTKSIRRRPE